ncbi:MAG: DciA family protein [Janthinobacterium lividum]
MSDLLRTTLGRSLSTLSPLDRLGAAWPVVAGHAIGERSHVAAFDNGTVTVVAEGAGWIRQLNFMADQLRSDLARVSRVPLTDILFISPTEDDPDRQSQQTGRL